MQEPQVWSLGWEDPLEEDMATTSSILTWRIPWTEEPGKLQSMGSQSQRWLKQLSMLARKKRKTKALSLYSVRTQHEGSLCKPGSRPSRETTPAGTLILTFPVSGTGRNECWLSHLVCGIFVIAAWADWQPLNSILVKNEPELLEGMAGCWAGAGRGQDEPVTSCTTSYVMF